MERALIALLCRTSDRTPGAARGAEALARLVGANTGTKARMIGSFGDAAPRDFRDDLRDSRGCILEAGGQVEDALTGGRVPILFASDCSICLTTLPAALAARPDAKVLWLDAHGDFNAPDTTPSGFLGGMCLAGACGVWDAGLGATIDPARVVVCGARDIDPGERNLLGEHGVTLVAPSDAATAQVRMALDGAPVYVHLDVDVLDPDDMPAQFPAEGGFSPEALQALLEAVLDDSELVGAEVTALEEADYAPVALEVMTPLLQEAHVTG
ncbi:MAG TPA: arginase family protein [Thermoleophilaceae bacterium]|nr:arginase family protein [Thermoleophilaceae bacterium]